MRHFLLRSGITLLLFALIGIDSPQANGQEWSAWSQWTFATCYRNISYRSRERKSTDKKNEVQMEIKNNFEEGISINHFISNDPNSRAIYRIEISRGGVYTSEQFVDKDRSFYLILDKLRFSSDKVTDPYRDCDGRMAKVEEKPKPKEEKQEVAGKAEVTTDGKTWKSTKEEEEEGEEEDSNSASHQSNNRNTTPGSGNRTTDRSSGTNTSRSRTTSDNNTMSWEEQQALAKRQHQIREQEQAHLEQALEPLGETIVMMDNVIPEAKEIWGDFYLGADDAGGLSAWRLGIESRMYHGDNFIIYFGFAGMLATKFQYYFADDESGFRKAMNTESRLGLELQLGIGSRILGDEENKEDAGSALYWGLLGYIGGLDGGDLENPDDIDGFNVMGFYGPRLLVGYRMSHFSLRFSYSLCFTDKKYYMGLGTPPGAEDKHQSGLFQIQLGYSW